MWSDTDCEEEGRTVIIDNGSHTIKAGLLADVGYAGYLISEKPQTVFPSIIGRGKCKQYGWSYFAASQGEVIYVGDEAASKCARLKLEHPLKSNGYGGITENIQVWEKLWHHAFYSQLRIQPEEHPVIMTEPASNSKSSREKYTQIMFETFNVPSFYLANQSVMALVGYGYSTGIMIHSGHHQSHTVAVYEGYAIQHATQRSSIGGKHIDEYLERLMTERGHYFCRQSEKRELTNIKQKFSCILPHDTDYKGINEELKEKANQAAAIRDIADEKDYELPDGQIISIGKQRFKAPEILFKPDLIGKDAVGIPDLVINTVEACDIDLRKTLYETICVAGGNTMIDGFAERLKNELESGEREISKKKKIKAKIKTEGLNAESDKKEVITDRTLITYRGCAVTASHSHFDEHVVTKHEYDESGPGIVHRKCF